jgi:hypothetical protein
MSEPITLYTAVPWDTAIEIMEHGFRDGPHPFLSHGDDQGVWLMAYPPDANDGWPEDFDKVIQVRLR